MEEGCEYSVAITACATKELADEACNKLNKEFKGNWVGFTHTEVELCETDSQVAAETEPTPRTLERR
jgi:hypothetical protein